MKPEEKVEILLWDWFKKDLDVEVYFNRKNKLGWKKFTTKGTSREKPDLVVCFFNKFNGKEYIAIEVKDGNINRNIYNSSKIFSIYYKNYVQGKTKYLIDNQEIKISHFVVATQFSKLGKIFDNDNQIIDNINKGKNDTWRKMSFKSKTLPRCEYEKTRSFLRQLWANFEPFREKNKDKIKPSLGILVSDILTSFHPKELKIQSGMIGKPMIQIMQYKNWLKKPRWQQNIIKI